MKKKHIIPGNSNFVEETANVSIDNSRYFFRINKSSFLDSMGLLLLKTIYLLTGLTGLAGTLFIIIKVINSGSISNFNMVLVFGLACLTIAIMYAGLYGFARVDSDSERQPVNTSHSTHGSKKGAA
jgi:hypothetical protein